MSKGDGSGSIGSPYPNSRSRDWRQPPLNSFILTHEAPIRLGTFFGILALMALWELRAPRRALTVSKALRWGSNLGLVVLNSVLLRLLFPAAAVGLAATAGGSAGVSLQPTEICLGADAHPRIKEVS